MVFEFIYYFLVIGCILRILLNIFIHTEYGLKRREVSFNELKDVLIYLKHVCLIFPKGVNSKVLKFIHFIVIPALAILFTVLIIKVNNPDL